MTIIELLERNAREWPDDTALVEINPDQPETRRVTWHDFELVEPSAKQKHYRREITWAVFDEKANRVANMLRSHGIGKGKKVAILMMNCIDWLPIYFGILKTGCPKAICSFSDRNSSAVLKKLQTRFPMWHWCLKAPAVRALRMTWWS